MTIGSRVCWRHGCGHLPTCRPSVLRAEALASWWSGSRDSSIKRAKTQWAETEDTEEGVVTPVKLSISEYHHIRYLDDFFAS